MHLIEAEGAQFLGNETCRFVLVESEFGIAMDMVAPGDDLWCQSAIGSLCSMMLSFRAGKARV
ncbi:hypothetical protein [Mesorhizobium sp.]|uniref:hypothetical protein n=1 Tax=Mesorhizobium sp. TaxID=1871066 RepID=UPI00257CC984|nr:hypothetical protein [Mesorhizobium sp.]